MTIQKTTPPRGNELTLTNALTAVPANIPAKSTVVVGGASYTQAQLVAAITALLAPIQAARNAKLAFNGAVLARTQNDPAVQTFVANFKAAIIALFGRGSPILAQFGFTPHKPTVMTAGQKVVKAARAKATRAKLGTKGPQQKAQLLAQQPPAFQVAPDGTVSLLPDGDASNTAPASAANTPASTGSSNADGASGSSNPGSTAGNGNTPSGS
jgi:hypothetical protein